MGIEHIHGLRAYELNAKHVRQKQKPASTRDRTIKDTYEPSGEISEERSKHLDSIRKKIKSGFYNSGEVIEDLSNSFAKAFEKDL